MPNPPLDPARPSAPLAFSLESFGPLLAKEIERSRRYYRGFGLVHVQPTRRRQARELLPAISQTIRRADLVSHSAEGGLYILLPETPASGMPAIMRRLEQVLTAGEPAPGAALAPPMIRQAAYPRDGETPGELLEALSEEHLQ